MAGAATDAVGASATAATATATAAAPGGVAPTAARRRAPPTGRVGRYRAAGPRSATGELIRMSPLGTRCSCAAPPAAPYDHANRA